jgi:tRNA(Ile)-lysidine synthase
MTFDADVLLRRLGDLHRDVAVARYLVGFSGGLDSTVLLHALRQTREKHGFPIVAIHINHALQPEAPAWEEHCRRVAASLDVAYIGREVAVVGERGIGLEAAARGARYAAIKLLMQDNDVLLSAHHEEDQAETLLLNLMRGSGLAGLAGIGRSQRFGPGMLIRPMLGISRQAIEHYAHAYDLDWIDDPSNLDLRFDRNYLRREILPHLRQRWPAVSARLRHSAELAAESAGLQDDLAKLDLAPLVGRPDETAGAPDRLDIPGLRRLSPERQRNVLRYAIKTCGLPQAPASRLLQTQHELLPARADAQPLVRWRGAELRRYRQRLYLLPQAEVAPECPSTLSPAILYGDGREIEVGSSLGVLRLERGTSSSIEAGIDPELVANGLQLRFRQGGEKIRPFGRDSTRPLKKLLQERGVVPWMRQRLPLLYAGETLVAVADLWIAAECARDDGFAVRWSGKPSIF